MKTLLYACAHGFQSALCGPAMSAVATLKPGSAIRAGARQGGRVRASAPWQGAMLFMVAVALLCVARPVLAQRSPVNLSTSPASNPANSRVPSGQASTAEKQMTPQQVRQFVALFNRNIINGCLKNPPVNVANAQSYCSCYASAFTKRFEPGELMSINEIAAKSKLGLDVITLMMAPDRRTCAK